MAEKLSMQPYKGTRDFYPHEMRLRNWFFGVIRDVLENAAFDEYNGPMLESLDLYIAKSGEEIANKQTYNFVDRGDRSVAIRPEMTPTVARMVAAKMNDLSFPLRWFSIPNMYRYEATQRGRLREFWQLNVDIFGCDTYEADLDVIESAISVMRSFGADETMFKVRINNRRFFNDVIAAIADTDEETTKKVSKVIDRKNKVTREAYVKDMNELGITEAQIEKEELIEHIKLVLSEFSQRDQLVIQLYYYEELNLSEISEILNITESRISQIHKRLIIKIRERLGF